MTQPQYDPQTGLYGYVPQGYQQPAPAPYQQPAPQQYPPQPGYAPAPQGYQPQYPAAPQGYGAPAYGAPMPPQGPQQDLSGDLDAFYSQRQTGGGKGISWKGVPDGYTIQGVVARPIGNGDVFKETHPPNSPQAGQLRTNRDGSYKYAMQVPLKLMILDQFQARDYPEGEARLFLRGGLRDEMTRAMAEVGAPEGPPEAGAFVRVTLTHRKPGNNIATNMFAVLYRSPGTWESDPTLGQVQQPAQQPQYAPQQPAPAGQVYGGAPQGPYQQQAPGPYGGQPAQATPNPQQYAAPAAGPNQGLTQPQYGGPAYDPNQAMQYAQQVSQPNVAGSAQAAPNPQAYPQAAQDQGTQQPQGQPVNPSQGAPSGGYAPQPQQGGLVPQGAVAQANGQPQLPGMPNPNQPPVQAGVQGSALDPARQALLNRIAGQQAGAPAQPQG